MKIHMLYEASYWYENWANIFSSVLLLLVMYVNAVECNQGFKDASQVLFDDDHFFRGIYPFHPKQSSTILKLTPPRVTFFFKYQQNCDVLYTFRCTWDAHYKQFSSIVHNNGKYSHITQMFRHFSLRHLGRGSWTVHILLWPEYLSNRFCYY